MEYNNEDVQSKYALALSKYNTHLHDDEVQAKVDLLIGKHLDENNNVEVKKALFHCLDLTTLKCTDSEESVLKLTEKVNCEELAFSCKMYNPRQFLFMGKMKRKRNSPKTGELDVFLSPCRLADNHICEATRADGPEDSS